MSRLRHFARAIASGYAAIGANVIVTILSIPLALKYLPLNEFGLWALVLQITGYLALLELGMSGSVYRFLIDHKDDPHRDEYGAVLSTGLLAFTLQGILLAVAGWLVAPSLGQLMAIQPDLAPVFERLVAWQSVISGFGLISRGLTAPLQSHQRFDILNYLHIGNLGITFGALWLGLSRGWGLDSLPFSTACGTLFYAVFGVAAASRLGFLPPFKEWVKPRWEMFRRLIRFGGDVFLFNFGAQLFYASQVIVVSRTLGLQAAAAWAICTKSFTLAQQFVFKISDFAAPALTEMYVRKEQPLLLRRFREIFATTVIGAALSGGIIAIANDSFVTVWTGRVFSWGPIHDLLLALLMVSTSLTRCLTMCVGFDKKVGVFRYVYLFQGVTFVVAAWFVAPHLGFTGILACAICADLIWCGAYGFQRTSEFFSQSRKQLISWLSGPLRFALVFAISCAGIWTFTMAWPPLWRLLGNGVTASGVGVLLIWYVGLPPDLKQSIVSRFPARIGRRRVNGESR
jgi:O-antigen/teichoic acid export membrane protein